MKPILTLILAASLAGLANYIDRTDPITAPLYADSSFR
jgi:hypothetical protein